MKKHLLEILLSAVLATASIGSVPVFAAGTTAAEMTAGETTVQPDTSSAATTATTAGETAPVQEENPDEQDKISEQTEDTEADLTTEDVSDEEMAQEEEEEPVQENDPSQEKEEGFSEDDSADEQQADISATEEAVIDEAAVGENDTSSKEGDTSVEAAEIGETSVIEEEIEVSAENETATDGNVIASGRCGGALTWKVVGNTLTISGTGAMSSFYYYSDYYYPYDDEDDPGYEYYDYNIPWYDIPASITKIVIEGDVTSIGDYAFYYMGAVKSITIPSSMKRIGSHAFEGCSGLTSITLPDRVTLIGGSAFANCTGLTSFKIPASVTDIGGTAFSGCSSLTSITIPNRVTKIGAGAFSKCTSLTKMTIPNSMVSFGKNLFGTNKNVDVFFEGSKEEWDAIKGSSTVTYKSITYSLASNTFSVNAKFELEKSVYNYTGNPVKAAVTVTYNNKKLVEGKDYKLAYKNNTNLGTATVNVNGIGNYSGTAQLQFRIRLGNPPKVTCTNVASGMKVSWVKVSGATRYKVYRDGELLFTTSALAVTDKDVKYKGGTKFTYKVVATEKNTGDSELFKTGTYYRLMPVGIKSLTNPSAGQMTVTYDKSSGSSGYVVRYGLKSDMSDAKVITVQGQNTLSRTFGGMKKGKTYYVQVRTYKIDNGVRYYSGYCSTKTITIKK